MASLYFVDSSLGQWIIYLITLIFLVSLFFIIQGIMSFMLEKQQLEQVKLNALDLLKRKLGVAEQFKELLRDCGDSIVKNRLTMAYQMAQRKQLIDQEKLAMADHMQLDTNIPNTVVRYARPTMIMLGLLGTVWGFLLLAGSMQNAMVAQTTNDASTQFLSSFPALRGAFLTTFWALLATIILSLVSIPYYWLKDQYFADLESFTSTQLLPSFQPAAETGQMQDLMETVNQNTQYINQAARALETVSRNVAGDFNSIAALSKNFSGSMESQVEAQRLLHKDISILSQLVAGYKDQIEQSNERNNRVLESLESHNAHLSGMKDKMFETEFQLGDWMKEVIALSKDQQVAFNDKIDRLLDLTRGNLSNTQSLVNRFSKSIKDFEKSLEALQNHLSFFNSSIENASQNEVNKLVELEQQLHLLNQTMAHLKDAGGGFRATPINPSYTPTNTNNGNVQPHYSSNNDYNDASYNANESADIYQQPSFRQQNELETRAFELAEQMAQDKIREYDEEREIIERGLEEIEAKKKGRSGLSSILKGLIGSEHDEDV